MQAQPDCIGKSPCLLYGAAGHHTGLQVKRSLLVQPGHVAAIQRINLKCSSFVSRMHSYITAQLPCAELLLTMFRATKRCCAHLYKANLLTFLNALQRRENNCMQAWANAGRYDSSCR